MSKYYLHVNVANLRIEDPEGVETTDLDGALLEVARAANELKAEGLLNRNLTEQDQFFDRGCDRGSAGNCSAE